MSSPTIRYYCPNPRGFACQTILFIHSLSKQSHQYIYDAHNPDIIITRSFRHRRHRLYGDVLEMRRRLGYGPTLVSVCGESWKPILSNVDFSFSYFPSKGKNCLSFSLELKYLLEGKRNDHISKWLETPKTRFCNFVYSNEKRSAKVRVRFCQLLAQYKKVDCHGRSMFNMPNPLPRGRDKKLNLLAHYKFTIAFENKPQENYITEKIYHAFNTGSIPIYWGSHNIAEYFNPAAFINCHDYRTFDDVVARVKEIDTNPTLYKEYLNAPVLLPGSRLHTIMRDNVRHYEKIIEKVLTRRRRRNIPVLHKSCTILFAIRHLYERAAQLISWLRYKFNPF